MVTCSYCSNTHFEIVHQYDYTNLEDGKEFKIDGYVCKNCKCIHSIGKDGTLDFFEFMPDPNKHNVETKIGQWATNHNT